MLEEIQAKKQQEVEMQEELEGLKESLQSERQNLKEIISDRDKLKRLCEEKDSALQVRLFSTETILDGVTLVSY